MPSSLLKPQLGSIDWKTGTLQSRSLSESVKTLGQLAGIFRSRQHWANMDPSQIVYRVQWLSPSEQGREGGVLWGNTTIEPGRVGDEYFMTHGHFHAKRDRTEFYSTISGSGYLVLMDSDRNAWAEEMSPGSLHYVPGGTAHRTVNTGDVPLRFVACWPSDAGHDYATVAESGFPLRVVSRDGKPHLLTE